MTVTIKYKMKDCMNGKLKIGKMYLRILQKIVQNFMLMEINGI